MKICDLKFDLDELTELYTQVGWTNYSRDPELIRNAFAGSLCVLGAYEDLQLAGIIRAVGDGASILYIQDIVVRPDMQRKGVGTALVRAMLERYPNVYQTVLLTDDTDVSVEFYKSLGFTAVTDMNCRAFVKINCKAFSKTGF